MPTPTFRDLNLDTTLPPAQQVAAIQDYIVKLIRDLNYLTANLDTVNINRLDAKVIIANSITALQIAANTITADKMNVTELSAISANLGKVIAGILIGAYISTADGTYPRIDFSATDNLLKAMLTATNYISIYPGLSGPVLEFNDGTVLARMFNLTAFGSTFGITSDHNILIQATAGNVGVESVNGSITDLVASINNLTAAVNSKAASGSSTSSVAVADNHNHGIPDGTVLSTPTGTVTFVAYAGSAGHTHTI